MEFIDVAIKCVKKSGKLLKDNFEKENIIKKKLDNSYVTNIDLESERIIINIIEKEFPNHSIMSEEKGFIDKKSEYLWSIDPVDGTHNYMNNIPFFGITISLFKENEIILGVIYLPYLKELFYAEKNKGSYLNGKRINVSNKNNLSKSIFAAPSATCHIGSKSIIYLNKTFIDEVLEIRMVGTSAMRMSYIASGRFDFEISTNTDPLDCAAGQIIVTEAGGKITQIDGKEFTSKSTNYILSNSLLHNKILKILNK